MTTFSEIPINGTFRRYRWDGIFDPKGTIYTKVVPFMFAGKHLCNTSYVGRKGGQPRTYYDFSKDSEKVEPVSSTG